MVYKNKLPCIRIGDSIRFIPDVISNLLKGNKTEIERTFEYNNQLKERDFNSQYCV
jgi:hypothetical protein